MDDEVIFRYTSEQAIEDGALYHPFPQRWPWLLITASIHSICNQQEGRTYEQALVPLLLDCIMEAKNNPSQDRPWILDHTVAGTVWIAVNEKGGLTVMTPEEF
jgi:hypothetical protein